MSDALLKKLPDNILIQTLEFDSFKRETEHFAQRLMKIGKVKEFTTFPGAVHGLGGLPEDNWVKKAYEANYPLWIECYLRRDSPKK